MRHEPLARTGGGGLVLTDSLAALRMTANLPATTMAANAMTLVRDKVVRGLSVEFDALREYRDGDIRVIARAKLGDIALVDRGQYKQSIVEARGEARANGKGIASLTAMIPKGPELACECQTGECKKVVFADGAFSKVLADANKEILAVRRVNTPARWPHDVERHCT